MGVMDWDKNVSPVGWYIASYIIRFVELGEDSNDDPERKFLTWENTILVKAADLDEAYGKTIMVAGQATKPYKGGPAGIDVQWVFEGVSELLPIYEDIEDGCEVMWAEYTRKLKNIRKRVREKGHFHDFSGKGITW